MRTNLSKELIHLRPSLLAWILSPQQMMEGFISNCLMGMGNYDWLTHGRKQALPVLSMEVLYPISSLMISRSERNIILVTMMEH